MDKMIITQTFTMARWQNNCQKVRGNKTKQRPKQQQNKKSKTKQDKQNKQKANKTKTNNKQKQQQNGRRGAGGYKANN